MIISTQSHHWLKPLSETRMIQRDGKVCVSQHIVSEVLKSRYYGWVIHYAQIGIEKELPKGGSLTFWVLLFNTNLAIVDHPLRLFLFPSSNSESSQNGSRLNLKQSNWRGLPDPLVFLQHCFRYSRCHGQNQDLGPRYSESPWKVTYDTTWNCPNLSVRNFGF